MSEWKIEEDKTGLSAPSFTIRYGDFKGMIHINQQPSMFGGYSVRWYVFRPRADYSEGPLFEGTGEVSEAKLRNAMMTGKRMNDQTLIRLLMPTVSVVHFALFCCVAEKLICD